MCAGPPLAVDLWDSLSPDARALIRTLQAEAAELRAKVASGHPSREDAATNSTPVPFPADSVHYHYTRFARRLVHPERCPADSSVIGTVKRGWHGVFHDHHADRGGEALSFFLKTPQAGLR